MAIKLGGTIINKKLLGVNSLNKIMLGVIEIFPNIGGVVPPTWDPSDLFAANDDGLYYNFNIPSTLMPNAFSHALITAGGQTIGSAMNLAKVETQSRINLFQNTEQMAAGAPWTYGGGGTFVELPDQSPVAGSNAYQMTDGLGISGDHRITYAGFSFSAEAWTISCYAKDAVGTRPFRIVMSNYNNFFADFNLQTGTFTTSAGATGAMTDAGNGWWLCSMSFTAVEQQSFIALQIANGQYVGDGSSIIIASPQLQKGALTNYQPISTPANQTTSAARPLADSRYNLLAWTNDFANAVWVMPNGTKTPDYGLAPDGSQTACRLQFDSGNTDIRNVITPLNAGVGTLSAWVKGVASETVFIGRNNVGGYSLHTFSGVWERVTLYDPTFNMDYILFGTWNGATTRDFEVWNPQAELGTTAKDYQWVNTATDYNWQIAPLMAKFDGVDDFLTGNLDTSGWTEWTVVAQWGNSRVYGGGAYLFANYNANLGFGVFANVNTALAATIGQGTGVIQPSSVFLIPDGEVGVTATTWAADVLEMSKNNSAPANWGGVPNAMQTSPVFNIGVSPHDANTDMAGPILSIVVINRKLTPAELTQYYDWCVANGGNTP